MPKIQGIAKLALPYPVDKLIPHQPPMMLIDKLVERSDDKTTAAAITSLNDKVLFGDPEKGLTPEFFIEIIAQTIAAAKGFDDLLENKKSQAGFLVSVDDFSFTGKPLNNFPLRIEIEKAFELGDMAIFHGKLFSGELLIVSGKIQVWEDKGS